MTNILYSTVIADREIIQHTMALTIYFRYFKKRRNVLKLKNRIENRAYMIIGVAFSVVAGISDGFLCQQVVCWLPIVNSCHMPDHQNMYSNMLRMVSIIVS